MKFKRSAVTKYQKFEGVTENVRRNSFDWSVETTPHPQDQLWLTNTYFYVQNMGVQRNKTAAHVRRKR